MHMHEAATCTRCGMPASAHPQRELARRVMDARRDNTICPRCKTVIRRGQQIGELGIGWCHIGCITGRKPIEWPTAA